MKRIIAVTVLILMAGLAASAMAGTKTLLLDGVTGVVEAGSPGNTFEITDTSAYKCVKAEGFAPWDVLNIRRENYAGDGWELFVVDGGPVQLSRHRTSACPAEIGVYTLEGKVEGPVTAYTEE